MSFRSLTLLGSTGSIGRQTLDVVRQFGPRFRVEALAAAGRHAELLAQQVAEFSPSMVHVGDPERLKEVKKLLPAGWHGELLTGPEGLRHLAAEAPAELVVVATVGWTGLEPALAAIAAGRHIALANKEVLVCGGHLVTTAARERDVRLLPVDSEHNAIFQCLAAGHGAALRRLILTCSGGPFLRASAAEIDAAGPETTLRHPTWSMGSKISVDSATLMNKGFEVIEAHHLFRVPYPQIEVIVHPQSTIHSMVEFVDGSIIAQLGRTDMRLPIQHVLTWPERHPAPSEPLRFEELAKLTFDLPDHDRFPALQMAYAAGEAGGSAPCVLNAANEIAVSLHLDGRIRCGAIWRILRSVMDSHTVEAAPPLESLRKWDAWGRARAREAAEEFLVAAAPSA